MSSLSKEDENYILGMTYYDKYDYDCALIYLKEAAKFDNYNAEYVIGSIYEFVRKDYQEAIMWYKRADEHDDKYAKIAIRRIENNHSIIWEKSNIPPDSITMHEDDTSSKNSFKCWIL